MMYRVTFKTGSAHPQQIERTFDNYQWARRFMKKMPFTFFAGENPQISVPFFFDGGYYQDVIKNKQVVAKVTLCQIK